MMRILLTAPYVNFKETPISLSLDGETDEFDYAEITDLVKIFMVKKGLLKLTGDTFHRLVPNATEDNLSLASTLFQINLYKFYNEEGVIDTALYGRFSEIDGAERISWFETMGGLLTVRFGIKPMEILANRLFETYNSGLCTKAVKTLSHQAQIDISLFGKSLWPLYLAYHVSRTIYFGDDIISAR